MNRKEQPPRFSGREALGAVIILAVALVLPQSGALGIVRAILAGSAMIVIPGWLIVRRVTERDDWNVRLFGGLLVSVATYIVVSCVAYGLHVRVTAAVVVIPAVVMGLVLACLPRSPAGGTLDMRGPFLAIVLSAAAILGVVVTHLAIPAVPVESAYSLSPTLVTVSHTDYNATIHVVVVGHPGPGTLTLSTDGVDRVTMAVPTHTSLVHLRWHSPSGNLSCADQYTITSSNGAYLSPRPICRTSGTTLSHATSAVRHGTTKARAANVTTDFRRAATLTRRRSNVTLA